jgi:hypothetical protein
LKRQSFARRNEIFGAYPPASGRVFRYNLLGLRHQKDFRCNPKPCAWA